MNQHVDFPQSDALRPWQADGPLMVLGLGAALPGDPIKTPDLLAHMDATFGVDCARRGRVFAEKLGIEKRHLARDLVDRREGPRAGDSNPELAARAVQAALKQAGLGIDDIGYLIGHTASPARPIPMNTAFVADHLNYVGPHMELRQACTGFANALVIAHGMLSVPNAKPVVIVGSETGSVFFDPAGLADDHSQLVNMVQMGDGAAAIILAPQSASNTAIGHLSHMYMGSIGQGREPGFTLKEGGSDQPYPSGDVLSFSHLFGDVRAQGADLFLAGLAVSAKKGITPTTVDHILPHQANGIMDRLMAAELGIDPAKVHVEADHRGNTGSAAIWLGLTSLADVMRSGEKALVLGAEATKYLYGGCVFQKA